MSDKRDFTAAILLIILAMIWGTSFILIKKGLVALTPSEVGSLRVVSAAFFLLPLALTRLKGLTLKDHGKLLTSGLLGILIPSFLFSMAQTRIESSIAGVMNSLTPIWTMMIGAVIFSQRFKGYAVLGTLLGFGGTIILIAANSDGGLGKFNAYALFIVLATVMYGSNLNIIKFKIEHLPSLTITAVSVLLIGPIALTYLLGFTDFVHRLETVEGAWKSTGFVVILGLMSTAVAVVLFNRLVKTHSPLFASSVTYLIPIVAVMWGVLDGERLYFGHYIGMAAIIGGVYLANRKK